MIITFFSSLLSGKDDVSSNRTIATIAFIALVYIVLYSLLTEVENELVQKGMDYLFWITILGLGFKGAEKVLSFRK